MVTAVLRAGQRAGVRGAAISTPLAAIAAPLLAALFAAVLYLPSIGYGFVFDDLSLLGADGAPQILGGDVPYRPLRHVSYLLDAALGGSPAVFHAHNVALHALVAALVALLATRLGAGAAAAFAGAALAAAHPLAVESVAYVAGRRDLLCTALGLGALLLHLAGRRWFAGLLLVAAAAAKESGLVFAAPMLLASLTGLAASGAATTRGASLHAAFVRNREEENPPPGAGRARWLVAACAAPLLATLAAVAFVLLYGATGPVTPTLDAAGAALPGRVAAHYLAGLVFPVGLAPEYPALLRFTERAAVDPWRLYAALAGTVLLVAAASLALRSAWRAGRGGAGHGGDAGRPEAPARAGLAFAAAWTAAVLVALATAGGLHEPGADRHAYLLLPALGVGAALALNALAGLLPRSRLHGKPGSPPRSPLPALASMLGAVLLVGLSAVTRTQMEVWRSERSLWTHAMDVTPASRRARHNMARVVAADGEFKVAEKMWTRLLARDEAEPLAWLGRAAVRCAQGRPNAARLDLARAHAAGADHADVEGIGRDCPLPEFQG